MTASAVAPTGPWGAFNVTMSVLVSNYSGPYTAVVHVFDEAVQHAEDGPIPQVEEHELPPGQCVAVTLWQGRAITIVEKS